MDTQVDTETTQAVANADVSVRVEGRVGRLTLCRPKALNALSHEMALTIEAALLEWQTDDDISLVLIDAEGEKAFCAGGDVATLYHQGKAGDVESGRQFWRDEYRLNTLIDGYAKPYVAVMDGITMGGGIGISAHGSHRIVTERSSLALPECSIGLVPDVGASHLLSQAPGHLGEFLALTGERLNASDALFVGFADYHVPVERLGALKDALIESGDVSVLDSFHESAARSVLVDRESEINRVFGAQTLVGVMESLEQLEDEWAQSAAKKIGYSSPLSLLLAFDLVRQSRSVPGIEPALTREYRFVSRAMEYGDILEGIRAALIDRDRQPNWKHASISAVPQALIDQFKDDAPGGDPDFKSLQG
ncbi:enoyl-CoA hydratase/isomerase family protein [Granulosicoccus antarcticus]|uniref:3-hydroxyisobutyryl-CoA hydrolase n=1 Tax=Granulosicoccus antarcticus IMCC3135 TaxID=1192854 RepID=A0A2Z2NNT9_9GAMM|nr:enoyl-CoA hydratase/isomerase family protein [Granulosicoccus antarcticus]ASJ72889.1 Short-chain-enoyl-CoA hydratase [Granulosicoccus antarcticus IMCC3135]